MKKDQGLEYTYDLLENIGVEERLGFYSETNECLIMMLFLRDIVSFATVFLCYSASMLHPANAADVNSTKSQK